MLNKTILPLWIIAGLALLLYSFTQVDLSLTLSQASIFQQIQKSFQYIGWFNRPLSTYLYVGLLVYLFSLFLLTVVQVSRNRLTSKGLWTIIILVAVTLIPSYNAFSYDLFNYIFDARIITHYGSNPYELRALDFPTDPMLSFMRSTHRVYPYGPTWLGITVPLTFISVEIFAFSWILFKSLSALAFLGTVYYIKKIGELIKLKNVNLAVILFALNPLVIIESLVSSHNEIVMMFFTIFSFYLLLRRKILLSFFGLFVSAGIKYSTVILLPIFLMKIIYREISDKKTVFYSLTVMVFAVIVTSLVSGPNKNPEFQPWYLLMLAPFISLYENRFIKTLFITVSFTVLLSYVPFLYFGTWPEDIVQLKNVLLAVGLFLGAVFYILLPKKNN